MKIKICGITNIEDALLCESFGADALGFIFYKGSKRFIAPEAASEISALLSPFTMKVGVFVNESPEAINKIAYNVKLNAIQVHGDETPEVIKGINLPVIKSFRVDDNFNYGLLEQYNNMYYLLDTYSNTEYGGTGKTFDWGIIPEKYKHRIILAGGISINNIEEIYDTVKPAAVDLSSSLESAPGKKDKEKVKSFFEKIDRLKDKACL